MGKSLKQVQRLIELVKDLFDISKIQAGKMQLEYQQMEVTELAAELIEMQSQIHPHEIILTSPGSVYIYADRMRLEQVLINFITNAVKYSPERGKIEIIVNDKNDEVTVSVKDEGIGIAAENLKHIFSQFYRAPGLDKNISGLGLGLCISKQIIEKHGGTVSVASEHGKGSVFSFSLPKVLS